MATLYYDEERAISVLSAFGVTSGLGVTLFNPSEEFGVEIRYSYRACRGLCARCKHTPFVAGQDWPEECKMVHRLASVFADNAGSSYLYICPADRMFFVAPVVSDSRLVAAATVGPVRLQNTEELLSSHEDDASAAVMYSAVDKDGIPIRTGEFVQNLALMLSASMYGVGTTAPVDFGKGLENALHPLEADAPLLGLRSAHVKEYPAEFETKLIDAVRQANAAEARHALNEILGYLLSSSLVDSRYRFRERIDELVSVVSHAALRAGVTAEMLFPAAERCRSELRFIASEDQMCSRAHHFVEQTIALVQKLYDVEFDDFKYRALSYIHNNYRHRITLEAAADALGFSPSYFSRSFKDHMGCTFVTYLNEVRVQAAKSQLISTDQGVSEIADAVGFESVSYFIRVFKREAGMTPGMYRARRGQMGSSVSKDDAFDSAI